MAMDKAPDLSKKGKRLEVLKCNARNIDRYFSFRRRFVIPILHLVLWLGFHDYEN